MPGDAARSVAGIAIGALASAAVAVSDGAGGRRAGVVALAAVSAVGLALDAGNNAGDIAWFGLCILAFCTSLTAGPPRRV